MISDGPKPPTYLLKISICIQFNLFLFPELSLELFPWLSLPPPPLLSDSYQTSSYSSPKIAKMVLQLFFTLAFSAVPLTLYVPPIRSLNFFVETMEDLLRESRIYTNRIYPRARVVWSRLLDCVLCSNMREK
ncbi:uncharacterized protein LOC108987989 isoform X3 [Juglans regia]|uniref:Uncharacterized protein LOC108987989 isoform X3 n=1 Tax=Juglans regia TaxID=51240 RepID=A0A2I4EB55_JUGRE|nr:uncharacterized protein LOC108987989 isoform X3 [Juglans regia]